MANWYFEIQGDDPIESTFDDKIFSKLEMQKFIGSDIQVGDESYDIVHIIGIISEEEALDFIKD